jgi:peptidoglycan hydrolase CwlO-like protein
MQYLDEIKEIVTEYSKISAGLNELERMAELLQNRRSELDSALQGNKQKEAALIDKIVKETGEQPDYYKIMLKLNEN